MKTKTDLQPRNRAGLTWLAYTGLLLLNLGLAGVDSSRAEDFADPAFQRVWAKNDQVVKDGKIQRSWLWGETPRQSQYEDYQEAPNGKRKVQYFDKSRMEINNPTGDVRAEWFVTNGLLTNELVTGRIQLGDSRFLQRTAAQIPVGGDQTGGGPTYASFSNLYSTRIEQRNGFIEESIDSSGRVTNSAANNLTKLARYGHYEPATGHNIADIFWNWMQKQAETNSPYYATGLPTSEPYWAKFLVAGVERELLVQLFERRALTYNAANSPEWQIEMGNIGLHYYLWRYPATPGLNTPINPPATGATTGPTKTTSPVSTPVPTEVTSGRPPVAATATSVPTTPLTPVTSNQAELTLLDLINQYRRQNNLAAFRSDDKLQQAARWHSADMATKNYFSLTDSLQRDLFKRLTDFGYSYPTRNGAILGGLEAGAAFDLCKNTAEYRDILLNPNYRTIGLGYTFEATAQHKNYWAINLGGN